MSLRILPTMRIYYQALLFALATVCQADSAMFSQFIGATTIPATFTGDLAASVTICTNYLHGIPETSGLPASAASQVFQQEVDGVCQFCTSLGQTRVDACCGQPSSSVCFASFGGNAQPVTTTAASTHAATIATAVTGATATSTRSGSDAERTAAVYNYQFSSLFLDYQVLFSRSTYNSFGTNWSCNIYTGQSYSTSCRGDDRIIALGLSVLISR